MSDDDPAVMPLAELHHLVQKLLLALFGAADQTYGIIDPFLIAGNDRLEVQHFTDDRRDLADPAALLEVFERVHVEHDLPARPAALPQGGSY